MPVNTYEFHHLLNHFKGCGAVSNVLGVNMQVFFCFSFCQVWESCTVSRPDCINAAHVRAKVQELAGLLYV